MIPYGRQDISEADIDEVLAVLRSDFITQGPVVPKFEKAVAEYSRVNHAVAVNSATSALHIACLALGLGPGDILWTSPNTFVASSNCALYCGAKVDFVDIDPQSYNMSLECLEAKLKEAKVANKLPKVLVPVHYAGQSCDMAAIYQLSKEYGFKIIEDASHAIGGFYKGELIGNCKYSDITVFSFHPVKIITTGEGGMATTNDKKIYDLMNLYRSHGISNSQKDMCPMPDDEIWRYQQIHLGYNYRMTDIQAALGLSQLKRLDQFIRRRHKIAERYNHAFEEIPIIIPKQCHNTRSSYHLYPIRIRRSLCNKTQRQLFNLMWSNGIGVNLHYIPVYLQPYYKKLGFHSGYCPEAELYHKEVITLPIFFSLEVSMQDQVISTLIDMLDD